eukprot:jgi/Picsp_1/4969/NSC_02332-R1_histidine triad family protein
MKALLARLIGNPRVVHLSPEECVFCQIVAKNHKDSQTIIYEDDKIVIFPDIRPAAVGHYQIVGKEHILNVDTLIENPTREHYDLVRHMLEKGQEVLLVQLETLSRRLDVDEQTGDAGASADQDEQKCSSPLPSSRLKFGFHMEPFHSVLHLHMHGFILPHVPPWSVWKYHPYMPWWLPAQDLLTQLQSLIVD